LAAIAAAGLIVFAVFMPETKGSADILKIHRGLFHGMISEHQKDPECFDL